MKKIRVILWLCGWGLSGVPGIAFSDPTPSASGNLAQPYPIINLKRTPLKESRTGWQRPWTAREQPESLLPLYHPLAYRDVELVFRAPNWHDILVVNFMDDRATGNNTYLAADLMVDGVTYPEVGVQYKGNSSFFLAETPKKPLKVTLDAFVPGQNLYGYDVLTFNNGIYDPTLVREILCYEIMGQYMPVPKANLVRIRAGIPGDSLDLGVYVSVERLDKRFMREHFDDGNGNRYKAISSSMGWLGPQIENYFQAFSHDGGNAATAYHDLVHVLDVLNNTPSSRLRERLDGVLSIDRAIRQIAAGVALLNWDDLTAFPTSGHNYYLYHQRRKGQMMVLPWDWDLGFSGEFNEPIDGDFNNADLPLVSRLMAFPELRARFMTHLKNYAESLDWHVLGPRVQQLRQLAEDDITRGHHEFFTHVEYLDSHDELAALVSERSAFLKQQPEVGRVLPQITTVAHFPSEPESTQSVLLMAQVTHPEGVAKVVGYYQANGPFLPVSLFDDGAHSDGAPNDGVYAGEIPFQAPGVEVRYYIEAFSTNGAVGFEPKETEYRPFSYRVLKAPEAGDLVINEILAHSHSGLPDWIELHNTTANPISLGGWFLSDDEADLEKYRIAPGTVIAPKGFITFYETIHFGQSSMDSGKLKPFGLSENGEVVVLSSGDGTGATGVVAAETFGASASGVSLGRVLKPSTQTFNFVPLQEPTPGGSNALPLVEAVVLSEIMYHSPLHEDAEYLELENRSAATVMLFDPIEQLPWRMTDGIELEFPSNPPISLRAGERLVLVKDLAVFSSHYTPPEGTQVLQWDSGSLSNGGEKVELGRPGDVDADGVRHYLRVDRVNYDDEDGWPGEADGGGQALTRSQVHAYGNDVANWQADAPSPGAASPQKARTRLVYPWISHRTDAFSSVFVANNLSSEPATVQLIARRADGTQTQVEASIPAWGFLEAAAHQLFPELGSGSGFAVVLESASTHVYGSWLSQSLRSLSGRSPAMGTAARLPAVAYPYSQNSGTAIGFGFLPVSADFLSAPVVVNAGLVPQDVLLTFYNQIGEVVGVENLSQLQPGQPYAATVNSLLGEEDTRVRMVAEAFQGPLTGAAFIFNQTFHEPAIGNASTLPPVASPSPPTTLLFPWLSHRDGQFHSTLIVNNTGPGPVVIDLEARRESGDRALARREVPPFGFLAEAANQLFPSLGSGDGFSVVAKASAGHVVGQWVSRSLLAESGGSPAQGVAVAFPNEAASPDERAGKVLLFSYLPRTEEGVSAPVLVNLGTEPADVVLYFFDRDGQLLAVDSTSFTDLQPMRPYARLVQDLLPEGNTSVMVLAISSTAKITGVTFIFNGRFFEPAIGNAVALEYPLQTLPEMNETRAKP